MRIEGSIDSRLIPTIKLANVPGTAPLDWLVDSGFNGDLMMPVKLIRKLRMPRKGFVPCELADGKIVLLPAYEWQIRLMKRRRRVSVIASNSSMPAVGLQLLVGTRLMIDLAQWALEIED